MQAEEPPTKKKKKRGSANVWEATSDEVATVMNDIEMRAALLRDISRPETRNEYFKTRVMDLVDVFNRTGMLSHIQGQDLFKYIIAFLYTNIELGDLLIPNVTVHEFVNGYCQATIAKKDPATLSVEAMLGKSLYLPLHKQFRNSNCCIVNLTFCLLTRLVSGTFSWSSPSGRGKI